jgi:hypothetical protein
MDQLKGRPSAPRDCIGALPNLGYPARAPFVYAGLPASAGGFRVAEGEQRPVTVALVEDDDGARRTCCTQVTTITGS